MNIMIILAIIAGSFLGLILMPFAILFFLKKYLGIPKKDNIYQKKPSIRRNESFNRQKFKGKRK